MKVIYHCDDYGITRSITHRIADAWEGGLLDGFSIVANGDAVQEGGERLRSNKELDARIAVHLNLFEGPALGPVKDTSAITNAVGNLNNTFSGLLFRWWLGSAQSRADLIRQVENEWRLQIEVVRDLCAPRPIAALDGHLHIHMLPFLFPSVVALADEFDIREVRVVQEPFYLSSKLSDSFSLDFLVNIVKNRVLNFCVANARKTLKDSRVRATDAFVGVLYTGRMTESTAAAGIERCRGQGAESVEVLFHIGRASREEAENWQAHGGAPGFSESAMRDQEYEALKALRG